MAHVSVREEDFNISAEIETLTKGNNNAGAVVTFTGAVRDNGGSLTSMTLEHYPAMTIRELERIAAEAESRWSLIGCRVIHRYGTLYPGDNIVLVITTSAHRGDAFQAAEFIMDYLKTSAPFWKKESAEGKQKWVSAKENDDQARDRWS